MAVYLKSLPQRDAEPPPTSQARLVEPERDGARAARSTRSSARCATATKARATRRRYPPLAGNQSITMSSPVNSIRMVLNGGYPPGTKKNPRPHGMPPFSHILNDDEVAAVVTYIRVAWEQQRHAGDAGAGQRAAQAASRMKERRHADPLTTRAASTSDARGRRDRAPRPVGRVRGRRHRDRDRRGASTSPSTSSSTCREERSSEPTDARGADRIDREAVAVAAERRWAYRRRRHHRAAGRDDGLHRPALGGDAAVARRDDRPAHAAHRRASSSRATSARRWARTARSSVRLDRAAVFVRAAVHRRAGRRCRSRSAARAPTRSTASSSARPTPTRC